MNRLERYIHSLLEDHPLARIAIRDIYQRTLRFIPVRTMESPNIIVRPGYFFGFHNICPWSPDNKHLLTHDFLDSGSHIPGPGEPIGIGYFSGDQYETYRQVTETKAWNWQQGSMLQWLGDIPRLIFNDFDGVKNHARIISTDGVNLSKLEKPIAAVSPDGAYAACISFERLGIGMPGYGYASGFTPDLNKSTTSHDGLYITEMNSQNTQLFISIDDIVNISPKASFKESYHFFSHCLFSPNSKRLLFFHRWLQSNGALKTRMCSCDIDGNNMYIFPTNDFVSHCSWMDNDHVIAFAGVNVLGNHYFIFPDMGGKPSIVGRNFFTSDGHPSISPDKRFLITDTYPNRYRLQHLILYDMENAIPHTLLKVRIAFKFRNENRCDFHPRWDRFGQNISFDSAHKGLRSHCTIAIDPAMICADNQRARKYTST